MPRTWSSELDTSSAEGGGSLTGGSHIYLKCICQLEFESCVVKINFLWMWKLFICMKKQAPLRNGTSTTAGCTVISEPPVTALHSLPKTIEDSALRLKNIKIDFNVGDCNVP